MFNGEWNSTATQKICANNGDNWQATVNQPTGNTAVMTYPDVQLNYNSSAPAVSGLNPSATSSFAENMNANSNTSAEAGYDIWLNNGTNSRSEVMIWTDTVNRGTVGGATFSASATFNGMTWQLWHFGSELIWYPPNNANMTSGTVYPAQMLQWLQSHGYLGSSDTLSQFEYGFEVCSTGSVNENFQVTGYSVSGLPAGN